MKNTQTLLLGALVAAVVVLSSCGSSYHATCSAYACVDIEAECE